MIATTELDHGPDGAASADWTSIGELSAPEWIVPGFTPREMDVLCELAKVQSNKQIGKALILSPETVKHHLKAIFLKLKRSKRGDAVSEARRRGAIA